MTPAKTVGHQMARRLDARDPILDAKLPDRSPVSIIIDPCFARGACMAILKLPDQHLTWDDLLLFGSID